MMGRDLVAVDTVPAGNVFAVGGLEGKVWRNATLCALDSKGATGQEDQEELKAGLVNLAGVIMTVSLLVRREEEKEEESRTKLTLTRLFSFSRLPSSESLWNPRTLVRIISPHLPFSFTR